MHLFRSMLRTSPWILLLAMIVGVAGGLGNAALIALINQSLTARSSELGRLGLIFLLVAIGVLLARTLSQTLFMWLGQHAKASLRMQTIRRIGEAAYADLERQGGAKSLAVLTQDLDSIVTFFVGLPALAMYGAVIVGCLAYLGYLSWLMLLFAVAALLLGVLGYRLVASKGLFHLRGSRRREDELIRHFRALFDGAKELKLHRERKRAFIEDTLAPHVEAVRRQRTRGYVLYAAASSWGSFILLGFIGCALFLLGRLFPVAPPVMSGYALVFLYLIMPIDGLLGAIPSINTARVALERIEQVQAELSSEPATQEPPPASFTSLVLEGVTHSYYREQEDGIFTLGPIDLSFQPGELVYLIGGNGSGKTTLAKLLTGLYAPDSGRILLDGKLIGEAERDRYRQYFAAVFNDFFLFDNLLGLPVERLDGAARQLLARLQLESKVRIEHGVFSTLKLSQGQRKRLALLVSYLENRPFYLFDEWAADQDPAFKQVFYQQLLPMLRAEGKTVLVITHDDRYFHLADRYIKLDYGQVVQQGRGEELSAEATTPFREESRS